ncbi:GNAT family N-acetyltransferase [Deinococcus frigens]|uniref:GNAT family N-acetyltransferase n=1 Tax=Deinococcus frigens TaxID=249403 RepID=UPI000551682F|nr:GNAT family N-acetyltransferase [Deinococcus frigens]
MSELILTSGNDSSASAVLIAAALYLKSRGEPLWPESSLTPERLARHYPQGGWRVAWRGDVAVACMCLLDTDPLFWPEDSAGEALYLHKLAVHPDARGQGLSALLLHEAAREAAQRGRPWLRLDTATARPKVRAIYEDFGFQSAGQRTVKGFGVTLYQFPI